MDDILYIEGRRNGYGIDQCGETMTVGELFDFLQRQIDEYALDRDMKIYLINDNGYTYGNIDEDSFTINDERIDWY